MPVWWRRAKFSSSRAARERKIEHKVPTLTAAAIDDSRGLDDSRHRDSRCEIAIQATKGISIKSLWSREDLDRLF